VRIRQMMAADASHVADLTTQLGYPTAPGETTERLAILAARPDDHAALVAEEDGRAVGWVHVAIYTSLESGRVATIGGLVVDETHRSGGIGAELLAAAEEWARENGAGKMTVRSRVTRERAHRFYEREGYALVKTSHVFEKRFVP
jgi:GNAT superfamily N-acetyltransferase